MNLIKPLRSYMSAILHELREFDDTPQRLRQFGFVVGGIVLVLAVLAILRGASLNTPVAIAGIIGAMLVVCGLLAPSLLKRPYQAWMLLALILGSIIGPLVLLLIFVVMLIPIGVLRRLFGDDPLKRRFDRNATTYWVEPPRRESAHIRRPF